MVNVTTVVGAVVTLFLAAVVVAMLYMTFGVGGSHEVDRTDENADPSPEDAEA